MNKKLNTINRKLTPEGKTVVRGKVPDFNPARTDEFPIIQKAVARAVQEYGETLKKLAKDD